MNAAEIRREERILLDIEHEDLCAKYVFYHHSCSQSFTSPGALRCILNKEVADEDSLLSDARKRAFASLIRYVDENIIYNPDSITNVADLCSNFVEFLNVDGVETTTYHACVIKA